MRTVILCVVLFALLVLCGGMLVVISGASPAPEKDTMPRDGSFVTGKTGDQQLAALLVKLELRTRAVVAQHYNRTQSGVPYVDTIYKSWLARNAILPAAVADRIFSQVVPEATGDRAWVKMVVDEPRNPHNSADEIADALLAELRGGVPSAQRAAEGAYYYAEPIKAVEGCLGCHGDDKGDPDPFFPQYKKNGWKAGEIVGAVVARVEPEK